MNFCRSVSVRPSHHFLTLAGSVPAGGICSRPVWAARSWATVAASRPVPLLALVAKWLSRALSSWSAWAASLSAAVMGLLIAMAVVSAPAPA